MTIAVLDIGKTRIKVSAVTDQGDVLESLSDANLPIAGRFYEVSDYDRIESFLLESLRELGGRHQIDAIVPTTHGSTGALLNHDGSVTALPDYETAVPPWLNDAYGKEMDGYDEHQNVFSMGASHFAKQLFWLESAHPQEFARARWLLPGPQYWAWRLSGVVATEVSSLSASSHLWNSMERRYTRIVERRGWLPLMPALRRANEVLGPLDPAIADRIGLSRTTRIYCGVHDSTANLYRFQATGLSEFTLLSTGTWMLGMTDRVPIEGFPPASNVSLHRSALGPLYASIKSMAGREFAILCDAPAGRVGLPDITRVLDLQTFAVPSFVSSSELIDGSGHRGRIVGPEPAPQDREALALLYVCMLADLTLDRLNSAGPIVVDGVFTRHALFGPLLSALRPGQSVVAAPSENGTAAGAAMLAGNPLRGWLNEFADTPHASPWPELEAYRRRWRDLATQSFCPTEA